MDGWMDGGWITRSLNDWINGWVDGLIAGWVDKWMAGWLDVGERVVRWLDGFVGWITGVAAV